MARSISGQDLGHLSVLPALEVTLASVSTGTSWWATFVPDCLPSSAAYLVRGPDGVAAEFVRLVLVAFGGQDDGGRCGVVRRWRDRSSLACGAGATVCQLDGI
jgi:hypothetical protein